MRRAGDAVDTGRPRPTITSTSVDEHKKGPVSAGRIEAIRRGPGHRPEPTGSTANDRTAPSPLQRVEQMRGPEAPPARPAGDHPQMGSSTLRAIDGAISGWVCRHVRRLRSEPNPDEPLKLLTVGERPAG